VSPIEGKRESASLALPLWWARSGATRRRVPPAPTVGWAAALPKARLHEQLEPRHRADTPNRSVASDGRSQAAGDPPSCGGSPKQHGVVRRSNFSDEPTKPITERRRPHRCQVGYRSGLGRRSFLKKARLVHSGRRYASANSSRSFSSWSFERFVAMISNLLFFIRSGMRSITASLVIRKRADVPSVTAPRTRLMKSSSIP
jgi:hypothetical protein